MIHDGNGAFSSRPRITLTDASCPRERESASPLPKGSSQPRSTELSGSNQMSEKSEFPNIDISGVDRNAEPIPFSEVITGGFFMSCDPNNRNIYQKCQVVDGQPETKTVIRMGQHNTCWSTKESRRKDDATPVVPIKVKIICTTQGQ